MNVENLFDETAQGAPPAQTYTITVDGEALELTLEQLIEAAQANLGKINAAARQETVAAQAPNGNVYQAFLTEYPDIAPADIPPEVWESAQQEGSLVSAYRRYELKKLREELTALHKNQENAAQEIGPAGGAGENPETDPVIRALLGK